MLVVAAFAAAPARAQDAATEVPATQAPADPPPPLPPDPTPAPAAPDPAPSPPANAPSDPAPQPADQSPATDPATTTPDPAPADTGTGSPQSTDDHGASRQPSHSSDSGSGAGQSTPAPASTAPSAGAGDTTTVDTVAPSSDGYPGAWSGQDTFVVDDAKRRVDGAAAALAGPRGPLSGLLVLRAASHAGGLVVKARRNHSAAQVKPIGGPPGSGNQLPGQNPFFNLLSGPGGSAAGLALASILAILGAALVLPRDRSRRFRMPTVTWRPLAYVPPIELPG